MESTFDKLIKNELGYYEVKNKPSITELNDYYANKYYQESKGAYEQHYTDEEKTFFYNKIQQKHLLIEEIFSKKGKMPEKASLLDIGCGEGWALNYFKKEGWNVTGVDFSSYGCKTNNPECVENIIVGDVFAKLAELSDATVEYDVVWMTNVLEHVLDPIGLMLQVKRLIKPGGIFIIQVPNDFSEVQMSLLNSKMIDRPFWIAIPDHLSYFSSQSLHNLAAYTGWNVNKILTSFPIDMFLFNEHSNYVLDRSKGKGAHKSRLKIENLLHEIDPNKTNALFAAMADIGLGRELIAFMTLE